MQHFPHQQNSKPSKFDVFMLSDEDVAFLNNEAPKAFNDDISFEVESQNTPEDLSSIPSTQQQTHKFTTPPELSAHSVCYPETSDHHNQPIYRQSDSPLSENNQPLLTEDPFYSTGNEPLFSPAPTNSPDMVFSSISETRYYKPLPTYDCADINDVLMKVVISEPLLTEEDLLFLMKKEYTGHMTITRRNLKQTLVRNQLHNGYNRLQAYITGKSYD